MSTKENDIHEQNVLEHYQNLLEDINDVGRDYQDACEELQKAIEEKTKQERRRNQYMDFAKNYREENKKILDRALADESKRINPAN